MNLADVFLRCGGVISRPEFDLLTDSERDSLMAAWERIENERAVRLALSIRDPGYAASLVEADAPADLRRQMLLLAANEKTAARMGTS